MTGSRFSGRRSSKAAAREMTGFAGAGDGLRRRGAEVERDETLVQDALILSIKY